MKNEIYEINLNKAIVYTLLIILLVIVTLFAFFIPGAKDFKLTNVRSKHFLATYTSVQNLHAERFQELKMLSKSNAAAAQKLQTPLSAQDLNAHFSKHMSDLNISVEQKAPFGTYFTVSKISVAGKITDPKSIFNAIAEFNEQKNLLEINFPVSFSAQEDGTINVQFFATAYGMADLNATFRQGQGQNQSASK